ncbi:MAG TPA: hypothetical protein VFX02_06480 [Gammaproteobacteria bacterium]|nr:hypothetical protein [Gammaproteobacteria bacterium]
MRATKMFFHPLNALLCIAVLLSGGCGGGGGGSRDSSSDDTTPAIYSFTGQINAAPDTLVESGAVTISGIDAPASISISGGEYSVAGRPYRDSPSTIQNNQAVRVRVRSSNESAGSVSATLKIGGVRGIFTVITADFDHRIEAEAATQNGGANTVTDSAASEGGTVFIGSAGFGISTAKSMDAETLIIAYRADAAGALSVTVNGGSVGSFTLRPTEGAYATSSLVTSVHAGDVIAIVNETGGATETYIDYIEFAAGPFRLVSTLAHTGFTTSDGISVGPNGDIYVSGGPAAQNILRITPEGEISVFATGFVSANSSDFDSSGNLYVADYQANAVRKITPTGVKTIFASSLNGPSGIWVDQNDNVLVSLFGANFSGTGASVLRITPGGAISTYASGGGLQDVIGIVGDENGQIYASNWASGRIYKITDGTVTLLAQTGGSANEICYSNGYIYVPSPGSARLRRVALDGTVENFIGTSRQQTVNGLLADADFEEPNSCDFSADGTVLYVMDRGNGFLRKIDSGTP